jgi:hypothetical protein
LVDLRERVGGGIQRLRWPGGVDKLAAIWLLLACRGVGFSPFG